LFILAKKLALNVEVPVSAKSISPKIFISRTELSTKTKYYMYEIYTNIRNVGPDLMMIIVILLCTQLIVPIGASITFLENNQNGLVDNRPNHRGPAEYISNSDPEATVISSTPGLTRWYVGRVDYTIYPLRDTIERNDKRIDARSGAIMLDSPNKFREVISSGRGWIIVDHRLQRYGNETIKNIIESETTRIDNGQWDRTKLYYYQTENNKE
jgi:hypothetical protein